MSTYRARLTLIAFFSYMVMSGLLTQAGVILNTIALQLGLEASIAVGVFSWLTGGALVGTCLSMYLYSRFSIKRLLVLSYSALTLLLVLLNVYKPSTYAVNAWIFWLLGIACGCGLSGGAVIISHIYHAQQRASAFIATDCAFSAAGYLFPTLAGWMLANQYAWQHSYLAVSCIAIVILLLVLSGESPETHQSTSKAHSDETVAPHNAVWREFSSIINLPIGCMALGVCLYLIAQTSFLTWAPSYLSAVYLLSVDEAGLVVGNYWGASIVGLVLSAILVNFIPTKTLLLSASTLAIGLTITMTCSTSADTFIVLGIAFGFFTTCIYKVAISFGTQQVSHTSPMLVTLMLFSGSIGSTLAPVISGWIVSVSNEKGALWLSVCCYSLMMVLFVITALYQYKKGLSADRP